MCFTCCSKLRWSSMFTPMRLVEFTCGMFWSTRIRLIVCSFCNLVCLLQIFMAYDLLEFVIMLCSSYHCTTLPLEVCMSPGSLLIFHPISRGHHHTWQLYMRHLSCPCIEAKTSGSILVPCRVPFTTDSLLLGIVARLIVWNRFLRSCQIC